MQAPIKSYFCFRTFRTRMTDLFTIDCFVLHSKRHSRRGICWV
jgi:hypothetical protein